MNFLKRWLTVPESNDTKEIEVPSLWQVRWNSYKDDGCTLATPIPQIEGFFSEKEANDFALSLVAATKLLRDKVSRRIEVIKVGNK